VNYPAAIRIFEVIQGTAFNIEGLTPADMIRMREIMGQYRTVSLILLIQR